MQIKRLVDIYQIFSLSEEPQPIEVTYELTKDEICKAYYAQDRLFHIYDIELALCMLVESGSITEQESKSIQDDEEAIDCIINYIVEQEDNGYINGIMAFIESYLDSKNKI